MKICLINNLYPPHARGGAEQVVRKTVEGLLDDGHNVVLITTSPEGDYVWKEGKLNIYRFRPRNLFFYTEAHERGWLARLFWHFFDMFHIGSARYIKHILEKEKPDVVHTHNLMGVGFLVPRVIRKLGIRHLHHVHDVQLVEPSGIILKSMESDWRYTGFHIRAYTWVMKKLMGSPDVVISPSDFLQEFYRTRGFFVGSKLVVLRNPLTLDIQERNSESADYIFRFLYLGQVEEHKGVRYLIDAFKEFSLSFPNLVKLHVVGDGSLFEEIKKNTINESDILMFGRVGRENLPDIFRDVDMTIVPSLCYENSPTVVFESFAFGVPVLASDIEGIAELIEEGENGMTFSSGSVEGLISKMKWCVKNRDSVRKMGGNTYATLHALSQETYIERLVELYEG